MEIKDHGSAKENITSDERLICLLCHLSFFFASLIFPIIIYFIKKDSSKFVAFNSLQTIYFQLIYVVLALINGVTLIGISIYYGTVDEEDAASVVLLVFLGASVFVMFCIVAFFGIYSVIIGIKSYKGEIKKYPIAGNLAFKKIYGS